MTEALTGPRRRLVAGLTALRMALALLPSSGQEQAPAAPATPPEALPTADAVFEKYRAAIGGEAAIRRYSHRTVRGQFAIPAQGMSGDLLVLASAPDRMRLTVSLPGLGDMQRGYDGTTGWSMDPAVGPRLLEGRELAELKHSADFYEDLHDSSQYRSATVVGRTGFEGQDCYEVKVVRDSGFEFTEFFDTATGLLAGIKMDATSQMGTVPVTTLVGEYKAFGGLLTPTLTRQRMLGLESRMTISSITFDPIDPEAYELPPQIAALVSR